MIFFISNILPRYPRMAPRPIREADDDKGSVTESDAEPMRKRSSSRARSDTSSEASSRSERGRRREQDLVGFDEVADEVDEEAAAFGDSHSAVKTKGKKPVKRDDDDDRKSSRQRSKSRSRNDDDDKKSSRRRSKSRTHRTAIEAPTDEVDFDKPVEMRTEKKKAMRRDDRVVYASVAKFDEIPSKMREDMKAIRGNNIKQLADGVHNTSSQYPPTLYFIKTSGGDNIWQAYHKIPICLISDDAGNYYDKVFPLLTRQDKDKTTYHVLTQFTKTFAQTDPKHGFNKVVYRPYRDGGEQSAIKLSAIKGNGIPSRILTDDIDDVDDYVRDHDFTKHLRFARGIVDFGKDTSSLIDADVYSAKFLDTVLRYPMRGAWSRIIEDERIVFTVRDTAHDSRHVTLSFYILVPFGFALASNKVIMYSRSDILFENLVDHHGLCLGYANVYAVGARDFEVAIVKRPMRIDKNNEVLDANDRWMPFDAPSITGKKKSSE